MARTAALRPGKKGINCRGQERRELRNNHIGLRRRKPDEERRRFRNQRRKEKQRFDWQQGCKRALAELEGEESPLMKKELEGQSTAWQKGYHSGMIKI